MLMPKGGAKKKVLFICTHNSARSQMAEGLLNALFSDQYIVYSAGTKPSVVNPYAIQVMSEIGIDISKHQSKSLDKFIKQELDYVITVCDQAKESCPFFAGGKKRLHKSFEDPALFKGKKTDILLTFRRIRDEIKDWITKEFSQGGNYI